MAQPLVRLVVDSSHVVKWKIATNDLQQEIEAGQVVAIAGAGVSVGATNNQAVASWQGLLHHGVDYCRGLHTTGVTDAMDQLLHSQIDAGPVR